MQSWELPAKHLFAHDLKFRDFFWTPLGEKGAEHSGSLATLLLLIPGYFFSGGGILHVF